jgi:CTP:molybdopterin cytidylyltransferase MocA
LATRWAKQRACQALILALCDQPKLTAAHLDRLMLEHERQPLSLPVASGYCGKNAVPALFPETRFDDLRALHGDLGASALLNGTGLVITVPWPDGEIDVDNPDEARRLQANGD